MEPYLQQQVIAILSCILEITGSSEAKIKEGRLKTYRNSLFLGKDETIKICMERLRHMFQEEQQLILAIDHAATQKMDEKIDLILETARETAVVDNDMNQKLLDLGESLQGMLHSHHPTKVLNFAKFRKEWN